jgi:hypothetical protein
MFRRRELFRVESVGDECGVDSKSRPEIVDDRLSDGNHCVRPTEHGALDSFVQPSLDSRRPWPSRRLECPPVTQLGDPTCALAPECNTH